MAAAAEAAEAANTIGSGVEATDLTKWVLDVERGRHVWRYTGDSVVDKVAVGVQSLVDKHHLGLDTSAELPAASGPAQDATEAMVRGFDMYSAVQTEDGHWASDYGGPMFLMPGLIIACHVAGVELPHAHKIEMIRYLTNLQVDDGGWGIHIESPSTMFGTAMNYVAMRLLGLPADDSRMAQARAWIREQGGAVSIPSWGKFWLAVLGVYEWEGQYPVPPELWLLPEWLPMHPHRWWIHCRIVYLPMGWMYAKRATGPITSLIVALRRELYVEPYYAIDWPAQRDNICDIDMYKPHTLLHQAMFKTLVAYEAVHSETLRQAALDFTYAHICKEDEASCYIDIGPVNKTINMLCRFFEEGPESAGFKAHVERIPDYLWLAEDGMKMQGYNGSQLWDTAFALHAYLQSPLRQRYVDTMDAAYEYLDITQVREDVKDGENFYRHISKGAWPFSTRDHGNPIADCTAVALLAVLELRELDWMPRAKRISDQRIFDAINISLSFQNPEGGWATYERKRAPDWVEGLNPSEIFADIMVDYMYVELTAESVCALVEFQKQFPNHRTAEIKAAIAAGGDFIESIQRPDGSWYGSWAICFTYGGWFGVRGLLAAGRSPSCPAIVSACKFLLERQNPDGGWGESYLSCVHKEYHACESQSVQTAWAVMTLMLAQWPDKTPIQRGIDLIISRQDLDGGWPQERILGNFNGTAIDYTQYVYAFNLWALSMYTTRYPKSKL